MSIAKSLVDYFRLPENAVDLELTGGLQNGAGYFRLGPETICYGRSCAGTAALSADSELSDLLPLVRSEGSKCLLPFDPTELVENLRRERYVVASRPGPVKAALRALIRGGYYLVRPALSVAVRKHLQRLWLKNWDQAKFPSWPVARNADQILETVLLQALKARGQSQVPFIWFWPDGKQACAVMTHDVEAPAGFAFCPSLMDINDRFGIKSSFQVIPESPYKPSPENLREFRSRGFEVDVHDWNHDGHLYSHRDVFLERAKKINQFAAEIGTEGFRSGVLYRNTDWYDAFTFSYDMSLPSAGHLDPQPGGCCTLMPYFIGDILEIPVTTIQDYSLFQILNNYSTEIWKRQTDAIVKAHGMATFIVHPDYVIEKSAQAVYVELLKYLSALRDEQNVWLAPPAEVNRWWRLRSQMKLVGKGNSWEIEGPGRERAQIAYAISDGERLTYSLNENNMLVSAAHTSHGKAGREDCL